MLDTGLEGGPFDVPKDRPIVLNGHKYCIHKFSTDNFFTWQCSRSITTLVFSRLGPVSVSRDCTAHLWDVASGVIIRRFNHPKGDHNLHFWSNTNETRDKYRKPDVDYKNDKARHGDEQALAITFTRFDAKPVALICRLNRNQKEKKDNA
ncbi:hypothetical protein CK203_096588 [Vitis vinifera]|uniref:Uncharacterized protein n=1 Tax=Vitis vinifera TaxID=29760 RepID=A0A438DDC1_VITVI|nr:hypothetical protein CK203_096588 [Vitis vinifera]